MSRIEEIKNRVEENSKTLDAIVDSIIENYCKDLDRYVSFIKNCLMDGTNPPTDYELEDFCMNLSTLTFFTKYPPCV